MRKNESDMYGVEMIKPVIRTPRDMSGDANICPHVDMPCESFRGRESHLSSSTNDLYVHTIHLYIVDTYIYIIHIIFCSVWEVGRA